MKSEMLLKRISISPHILHGRPRIQGTRIGVSMVLELLAEGYSVKEITSQKFYPDLKPADIYACVAFANQFLNQEEIHFREELEHSSRN